jgi:hypothetical protein
VVQTIQVVVWWVLFTLINTLFYKLSQILDSLTKTNLKLPHFQDVRGFAYRISNGQCTQATRAAIV